MRHHPTADDPGGPAMSIEEWAGMPEDDAGELVEGRLVEEEVADLTHETAVAWLIRVLGAWAVAQGGFVFGSEAKFVLGPRTGRKPDVTVFLAGRGPLPRRGAVRVPPDIAVEIVSPTPRDGRRDRIEKADGYAAFGVRNYWIVDPAQRTLEIFELGPDGRYVRALGASGGRLEPIPDCPGLALDLDGLWREIERLDAEPPPGGGLAPERERC